MAYNDDNGKMISVLHEKKMLTDTAVTYVFPAYPVSNLSTVPEWRKDSNNRCRDKEIKNIENAIIASIKKFLYIQEKKK